VNDFWEFVTWHRGQGEYRAQSIKHPIISYIQRALALTIFACNKNTDKVTVEEMKLLDLMLDPRGELELPDLMLHMVRHWVKIREETKEGRTVTTATYPTTLAYMLILDVSRYLMIPYTPTL
jgi:predicted transcriptional regulator